MYSWQPVRAIHRGVASAAIMGIKKMLQGIRVSWHCKNELVLLRLSAMHAALWYDSIWAVCVCVCLRGLTEIRHGKAWCQMYFCGWFGPDRNNISRWDRPNAHIQTQHHNRYVKHMCMEPCVKKKKNVCQIFFYKGAHICLNILQTQVFFNSVSHPFLFSLSLFHLQILPFALIHVHSPCENTTSLLVHLSLFYCLAL